jgi:predicted acetyltransferase
VRPSERGKWYATEMLKLGLIEAQKVWIEKLFISCDDDNIASAKVIEINGGILEKYMEKDGVKMRRYWINLL